MVVKTKLTFRERSDCLLTNLAASVSGRSTVLSHPENSYRAPSALHQSSSKELCFRVTPAEYYVH